MSDHCILNNYFLQSAVAIHYIVSDNGSMITTQGIVLSLLDFKDYNKIVTLFSETEGLIKLFVKLTKKSSSVRQSLLTPLVKGEFQLSKGRSDFYRFHDGSLLDQRMGLRKELKSLQVATQLAALFSKTQWPGEPSPALFQLFDHFLTWIPKVSDPERLLGIFYLKLFKHEGALQLHDRCSLCETLLTTCYRYKGERYCERDAPPPSILFTQEEESVIQRVMELREWKELLLHAPSDLLRNKLATLFEQMFG